MPSIVTRLSALILATATVAACSTVAGPDSNSIVSNIVRSNGGIYIRQAARTGEMKTEVYGNPYAEDATQVRDRTIAAMQGHTKGASFTFTPDPKTQDMDVRVAVALQPPAVLHPNNLCSAPGEIATGAADEPRVRMAAALCIGTKLVASVHLEGANPGSTTSAAFERQVGELTWELMTLPAIERDQDCEVCG